MRQATKSPLALASMALEISSRALPAYSCLKSRHDFTQHQLFAIIMLRQFLKTDYRGTTQMLSEFSDLRAKLGLQKVPHYTTLQKAEQRFLKKLTSTDCWPSSSVTPALAGG